MRQISYTFVLFEKLQIWSILHPFQHNPPSRPPGLSPTGTCHIVGHACGVHVSQSGPHPQVPTGPRAPGRPLAASGDAPSTRGWARPGRSPPPTLTLTGAPQGARGSLPAPPRPLGQPLRSRGWKPARLWRRAKTRQPQQPSWHIRLRPPRRRRVRPRRQRAPRLPTTPIGPAHRSCPVTLRPVR